MIVVWLLIYFLSPIAPVVLYFRSAPYMLEQPAAAISMGLAIVAYVWFCYQFTLAARPKFIDRTVGLDRVYGFHGVMAVVALALVAGHGVLLAGSEAEELWAELGGLALILFVAVVVASLLFLGGPLVNRWNVTRRALGQLAGALRLRRRVVVWLHNISFLAATAMLAHVLLMPGDEFGIFRAVMLGFYALGFAFYFRHKLIRPLAQRLHPYLVDVVVPEAEHTWTLVLKRPGGVLVPPWKPGQFVYLRIFSDGLPREEHPFTVSSSPTADDCMRVTIKEVGRFTSRIGTMRPGDRVLIDGPYGRFSCRNVASGRELLFMAGGIGITPMLSMLRWLAAREPKRKVTLLWGARTGSELFAKTEIEGMREKMPNLTFLPVASRDDAWTGLKGWVDREKVASALETMDSGNVEAFVCGPQAMMEEAPGILEELGIGRNRIHRERFAL